MTLLAVDIGNTNVHVGIREPHLDNWSKTWRFSTHSESTADDWFSLLAPHFSGLAGAFAPSRIIACSVVPALTRSFIEFSRNYLESEPIMASTVLDLGLTVSTDHPRETGADRIVNAAAAFADFGGPVVVIDMGTATKIDAVNKHGQFLGGAIAPGLGITMHALAQRAAQINAVQMTLPMHAIGTNTTSAVQSGVVLGHVKMIDGLVEQVSSELGGTNAVVITGGFSSLIAGIARTVTDHRPNLTLDGLAIIASRNT